MPPSARAHLLFGDQLGPCFTAPGTETGGRGGGPGTGSGEGPDGDAPLVMVESRAVFRRRPFHRAKAHLVLAAMRHRAAGLGDRVRYVRANTYRAGPREAGHTGDRTTVCRPASRAVLALVTGVARMDAFPARGFLGPHGEFTAWAGGYGRGQGWPPMRSMSVLKRRR